MNIANDQMARLEAAIAGQERLRSTLGDPVVDDAIAALRQQLAELKARAGAPAGRGEDIGSSGELASRALASLQSHLPAELAAKARATPWVEGERRQVTLVFADLSGFTSLSENADPEVIRTFQHDLFSELARIIYQYEGFVEKFVGDAVLAVFGAPVCHEDDAERALRAALAMRERMAVLNRRWSERLGTPVTLHVGVNTGSVVAGKIGSEIDGGSANYAVTGDTVNTAARLQDAAQPGQILVSRTTYRLAHGAFTFQALEPITVRNRREPLPVYELLRARLLPGKLRGIQELGEAFVGRERALEQLQAVTTGLAEHGGIVLITGDAGIGKSRLVAEWRKRTQESVRWLEGRCFAHTSALSYGPFLDMLRRLAGIVDDDSDRRARQRLEGALERLFPGDARARAIIVHLLAMRPRREEAALLRKLTPRQVRESIQVMADQLVRRMTQDRPLVIFLDDMQWADASTVELVGHLLDTTAAERLAVVIAGRPDPGTPVAQLESVLEGDQYRQRTERVSLDRLSDALSLAMMSALLSAPNLPPELGALISDKAEGNPFFVEEIIRSLIELGALKREGETWQTTPLLGTIRVPDTLHGLIMARIDRLPDETKEVVQHAAVIGRTFLYRVLLAIAHASPSLDADLSHLQRNELIRERTRDPEVEYTFKHALTQEMAYQSLLSSRQREFHRRVGEAMERIFADRLGEFYSILADHFRRGEVWDKAADYEMKAGHHASNLFAAEAQVHYERALEALERLRPTTDSKRRRVDVTIAVAREVLFGPGSAPADVDRCLQYLERAEPLAAWFIVAGKQPAKDDKVRAARLYAWLANVNSVRANVKAAGEYLDKAMGVTSELEDPELAARIGQVLLHRGQFSRAASFLGPAVGPLEARESWTEWLHANGALAFTEAAAGRYRAAQARAERGLNRARNLQGNYLIQAAENYQAFVHLLGGQPDVIQPLVDAQNLRNFSPAHPAIGHVRQVIRCWYERRVQGPMDRQEVLAEYLDRDRDADAWSHLGAWAAVFAAGVALRLDKQDDDSGRVDPERLVREALAAADARQDIFSEGIALRYLARALAAKDQHAEVNEHMRRSRDLLLEGGCRIEAARTLLAWGEYGVARKDPDARDRLREAARIFEEAELTWEVELVRARMGTG